VFSVEITDCFFVNKEQGKFTGSTDALVNQCINREATPSLEVYGN
jgi:hypothetical protein